MEKRQRLQVAFALSVLVVAVVAAGWYLQRPRIVLPETPLSVSIPRGFKHDTAVFTSHPSLYFRKPLDANGMGFMQPTLSVMRDDQAGNVTPIAFVRERATKLRGKILVGPRERALAVGSAAEIAFESTLLVDYMTQPADYVGVIDHEIVFEIDGHLYACRLESVPSEYEADRKVFESMCESVRAAQVQ
jgi:hypothetical protein